MLDLALLNLSPDDDEIKEQVIENWLDTNRIDFIRTSYMQYKILNGCEKNIMFYPSTSKVMFQIDGKNYIIQTNSDNIIAHIKGTLAYRKNTSCL